MEWGNVFAAGSQVSLISDLFRNISFLLDSFIYTLVPVTFNLIYQLYDFNGLIDTSTILSTTKKSVYSLLAIFMFFKLGFSLLGMLVNPDMIENKEKGAGKLVSGVAVCLVLIALMPMVFEYAMMVQKKVMEGQLIEKAIYGESFSDEGNNTLKTIGSVGNYTLGNRIALSTWGVFLQPTTDSGIAVTSYNEIFGSIDGVSSMWYHVGLVAFLNETTGLPVISGFLAKIPGIGTTGNSILNLFGAGVRYQLSYIVFISTAAGIFLLWSIIKLCIDVAYRSIKMFALEMLSPIAIISYIDPKSSKDGVFAKWVKEAVKTYTSLFVRIFVFAFVSVLLKEIDLTSSTISNPISRLFFILAIIAFIKAAPKFIDNILGTEISKDQDTKLAGDILKTMGTAGVATATGALTAKAKGYDPIRGGWEGMKSGVSSGWKAAKSNDVFGMIKAANGGDAMRKYFGLPNREEERKKAYENKVADETFANFKKEKNKVSMGALDKFKPGSEFYNELDAADKLEYDTNTSGTDADRKAQLLARKFLRKNQDPADVAKFTNHGFNKMSATNKAQYRSSIGKMKTIESDSILAGTDIGKKMIEEEKQKQDYISAADYLREATAIKTEVQTAVNAKIIAPDQQYTLSNGKKYTLQEAIKLEEDASGEADRLKGKVDDAKKATTKVVETPPNAKEAKAAKYYKDFKLGEERDG